MQTHCNRLSSLTTKLGTDSITDGNDKKLYTQTKKISYQQRVNFFAYYQDATRAKEGQKQKGGNALRRGAVWDQIYRQERFHPALAGHRLYLKPRRLRPGT